MLHGRLSRGGLPYPAVHSAFFIHIRRLRCWAVASVAGTLSGMSRVLICALLVTVLSGGAGTGMVALTGLAVPPGTADSDDPSRLPTRMFGWPLAGRPTVVRAFKAPAVPYGPGHRGVDLASVAGATVLAAGAGTVVFAAAVAGRGVVSVDHPGGYARRMSRCQRPSVPEIGWPRVSSWVPCSSATLAALPLPACTGVYGAVPVITWIPGAWW